MKLIHRTSSTEFANAVRIGFDREDIPHYIPDASPAVFGLGGHVAVGHSIFILDENDEARAREVMRELGFDTRPAVAVTPAAQPRRGSGLWWGLAVAVVVALLAAGVSG